MAKPARIQVCASKPYTSEAMKGNTGWHGIPGARHIPASDDPIFPHFTFVVTEWRSAGIEMTDELMAAALALATMQVERRRQQLEAEARKEERYAALAANPPRPGAFGDAPDGVVYYIRRGDYVKIGTTTRLRNRMRDLMPDEVLAVEPGSYSLEGALHAQFAASRLRPSCEYFRLTDDLRAHIDSVIKRCGEPPAGLSQFKDFEAT